MGVSKKSSSVGVTASENARALIIAGSVSAKDAIGLVRRQTAKEVGTGIGGISSEERRSLLSLILLLIGITAEEAGT